MISMVIVWNMCFLCFITCIKKIGWKDVLHLIAEVYLCIRHQMEAQAEEQAAEAQKERKLRERNEQYSRQLEEELEGLKVSVTPHTTEHEPVHRRSLCPSWNV